MRESEREKERERERERERKRARKRDELLPQFRPTPLAPPASLGAQRR